MGLDRGVGARRVCKSVLNPIALRLSLAQAASGLLGGAYTPFFGAWLAWRGLSPTEIGALLSTGMLLRIAIAPVTGLVADARNDRRRIMLFLYMVVFAGFGALNFLHDWMLIFAAAVFANISTGSAAPLLESVSVRLSERFGFDYGHVRLWASILFVAGNILSGVLVSAYGLIIIAPWLVVSAAFNLLAIYLLPPPQARTHSALMPKMRATFAEARELMRSPIFLIFLAAASLDQGSHAFYYGYGGLHWRALGYSGTLIGIIWPLGISAEILFMSFSLRIFRHHRRNMASHSRRNRLCRAMDIACVRSAAAVCDLRAIPARRDLCARASGRDVFHFKSCAAAAFRNRAKPLCRGIVGPCDGPRHACKRPALCRVWRTNVSADVRDGIVLAAVCAMAQRVVEQRTHHREPDARRISGRDLTLLFSPRGCASL